MTQSNSNSNGAPQPGAPPAPAATQSRPKPKPRFKIELRSKKGEPKYSGIHPLGPKFNDGIAVTQDEGVAEIFHDRGAKVTEADE